MRLPIGPIRLATRDSHRPERTWNPARNFIHQPQKRPSSPGRRPPARSFRSAGELDRVVHRYRRRRITTGVFRLESSSSSLESSWRPPGWSSSCWPAAITRRRYPVSSETKGTVPAWRASRGAARRATDQSAPRASRVPRTPEERKAILDSSITLIQRAALQPGGKPLRARRCKKLNQYFDGTDPAEYQLDPAAREYLATPVAARLR